VIRTHHLSSDLEEVTALCMWQNWMDKEETHWIAHYGTYLYGLNQAREGQLGFSSIAIFQTQLSSGEMPISGRRSSRRLYPVNIAKDSGPWAIPQKHEVMGVRVGKILHHIRTGNRSILQMHLLEMDVDVMGYNGGKSAHESRCSSFSFARS
jgi:hypothetical protein